MYSFMCIKEYVNGYELSVAVDGNCGEGFRADVALFDQEETLPTVEVGVATSLNSLASLLTKAREQANALPKGQYIEFKTYLA